MTTEEKKVTVGVDKAMIAFITQDDENAYITEVPQSLAPTLDLKGTPNVSSETLYADNGPEEELSAEGETEIEINVTNVPELLLARMKGAPVDTSTGRVFDTADPSLAEYFAFGYRFKKSNGRYRYRWYHKCRVVPPGEEAQSQSNAVSFKPLMLKIRAIKTKHQFDIYGDASVFDGVKRVHGDEDTDGFDPSTWFDAVQVPSVGTPASFTVSSNPLDNATGVAVGVNIVLTFSNPLAGGREKGITLINLDTQAAVAHARTINGARTQVTLDPSSNLSASTDYAVIIHDVVDIHGQALSDTVINFATA